MTLVTYLSYCFRIQSLETELDEEKLLVSDLKKKIEELSKKHEQDASDWDKVVFNFFYPFLSGILTPNSVGVGVYYT